MSAVHWGTSRLHTLSHIIVTWIKSYKREWFCTQHFLILLLTHLFWGLTIFQTLCFIATNQTEKSLLAWHILWGENRKNIIEIHVRCDKYYRENEIKWGRGKRAEHWEVVMTQQDGMGLGPVAVVRSDWILNRLQRWKWKHWKTIDSESPQDGGGWRAIGRDY